MSMGSASPASSLFVRRYVRGVNLALEGEIWLSRGGVVAVAAAREYSCCCHPQRNDVLPSSHIDYYDGVYLISYRKMTSSQPKQATLKALSSVQPLGNAGLLWSRYDAVEAGAVVSPASLSKDKKVL